jgi:AraC-like DNA-binding protein/mannose-6-phosphate isomerase-like protein (cupin superfamily)
MSYLVSKSMPVNETITMAERLKEVVDQLPCTNHIKLHTCYHLAVPSHWRFENRVNQDFHMIFIKGGKGFYQLDDASIPFARGQIIVVSPGMRHSAEQDPENPPVIIPVRFGMYDNNTLQQRNWTSPPFSLAWIPDDIQEFQQLFEDLYIASQKGQTSYCDTLCGTIISGILLKMVVEYKEGTVACRLDRRIEKVKRLMDENPHIRYNPDQLAHTAELSEKYFRYMFKRQYGLTPLEYQVKIRMDYAQFLIAESGQSIKQAALTLGYPDPYSFSKQFKHIMGYPPLKLKMKV